MTEEIKTEEVTTQPEKSVEQVKFEAMIERLKNFLKDENIKIVPKIVYAKEGIFPDVEVKFNDEPVRNIYDEQAEPTA